MSIAGAREGSVEKDEADHRPPGFLGLVAPLAISSIFTIIGFKLFWSAPDLGTGILKCFASLVAGSFLARAAYTRLAARKV